MSLILSPDKDFLIVFWCRGVDVTRWKANSRLILNCQITKEAHSNNNITIKI